jgi:hypothetical protein
MPKENSDGHGNSFVQIKVNNVEYQIHRGRQTVAEIKTAAGVPLADVLNQVVNEQLVPLTDDGAITLKGDEVFISHPRDSASS